MFEGSHDFFNFSHYRTRDRSKKNTCRVIKKISVIKNGDFFMIKIFAKGFLRYQIRAMIGEAVAMINNSKAHEILSGMLSTRILQKYKKLAPAGGLYL